MDAKARESIEHFVRVTLGCKCPDEVFRSIVIDHVGAEDERGVGAEFLRLTIGDRLLIYVFESRDASATSCKDVAGDSPQLVAALTRAGLAERDTLGFNRFRLVIAFPRKPSETAQQVFASVADTDDRAHLHLVDASALPVELRRR